MSTKQEKPAADFIKSKHYLVMNKYYKVNGSYVGVSRFSVHASSRALAVREARIMSKQENVLCDTVEVLEYSVKRVPFRTISKKKK